MPKDFDQPPSTQPSITHAGARPASDVSVLDQYLIVRAVVQDVARRPFIAIGLIGLLLLIPLDATSTKTALQRLGAKRWRLLHSLAYVVAVLGVIHFAMRVKSDATEPAIYAGLLFLLLGIRIVDGARKAAQKRARDQARDS